MEPMTVDETYLDRLIDADALAEYLTAELGEPETYEIQHHQEGHSNETMFVTWGERDLVIRRPPSGETADTAHDVLREYRVIDALQETEVRTPPTVLACEDHDVLGADFYVMERVDGDVLRDGEPPRFADPESRRQVGTELIESLAEIHTIDYDAVGLKTDDFGYPDGFTQRQVDRWEKQIDWAAEVTAAEREVGELDTVTEWLQANVPSELPSTLVHGDFKLDNVLFGPGVPPKIAAVFDWELSTLGDPFTDLGWMLSFWWDDGDPAPPEIDLYPTFTTREGYMTRQELIDRYESSTGFSFDNERFYRALAVYKMAALGEMFYRRLLEGNSDDPLYQLMENGVPQLAERAIRIIDGQEPL
jgi:aminoglycoside phosphotransferase (APT) family kinase protein